MPIPALPATVRRIYYRGWLDSCNYTCSYCPFGKKSHHTSTATDEAAWMRFIETIEQWEGDPLQLFIIPYGEALVHRYYREGIARLASLPHVEAVSCQTNLSFPAEHWLQELQASDIPVGKVALWASYHPEMSSVERFVRQLHRYHEAGMSVCAGAVGNPVSKAVLQALRDALNPEIYLFINAMQGLKKPLTSEDIRFFNRLDNLFEYDLKNMKACWEHCLGGVENCFVDGKGDLYACPRSRVKLANLYTSGHPIAPIACGRSVCDCYIAYSNRPDHPLHRILGEGVFHRIPHRPLITAAFFDIDGTLTDAKGCVPVGYTDVLHRMARSIPLYLATSLTPEQAKRRLGSALFSLFRGGLFADGALLIYDGKNECRRVTFEPHLFPPSIKLTVHRQEGIIYKYTLLERDKTKRESLLAKLQASEALQVYHRPPLITVVGSGASKQAGLLRLLELLHLSSEATLVVGNSAADLPMLSVVRHSCAVLDADPVLKEQARYTLNPDRIPAFFRFGKRED